MEMFEKGVQREFIKFDPMCGRAGFKMNLDEFYGITNFKTLASFKTAKLLGPVRAKPVM